MHLIRRRNRRAGLQLVLGTLVVLFASAEHLFAEQSMGAKTSAAEACPQTYKDFVRKHEAAASLVKAGKVSAALPLYAAAYSLCPADYQNAYDLALDEFDAGDPDKAKTLVALLLQAENRAELHTLLGRIEAAAMNYTTAALEFKAAAESDPSEENVFDYGTALFRLNYGASIKILRYGIEKYPTSVRMHVALGTTFYAEGLLEEGATTLCRAEELNPSDPHPMEIIADTEIVPSSVRQRVNGFFEALHRRYPKDGLVQFDYAMVKSGRWSGEKDALPADFVDSLKAALALNPKLHQAYFQLGLAYAQQGKTAQAIGSFQKAIALDPEKEQYHYRLASAYRKAGNQEGLEKEMEKFEELHKRNPESQSH